MYTIDYSVLEDAAYDAGLEPEEAIRTSYSGRFMYGSKCLGLVHGTIGELLTFVISLADRVNQDSSDDDLHWLDGARQDNMGMDMITYWPNVTVENAPDMED